MSKLIGQKVECTDKPNEVGVISYYDSDTGDMDITYKNLKDVSEIYSTHISKCKIVR